MLELPKQAQKMFVCKEEHLVIIAYSTARNLHVKFKKFKEYLPHNYSDFIEYCHPYEQMSITCLFYWKYSDEESFVCLGVRASNGVYHLIIASFEFPSYFKEITVFNFTSPITKICEYSAGKIVLCEGKNLYMITLSLQNPRTLNILMKLSVRNKITSIACDSSQSKIYIGDQKDGVIVVAVSPNSFSVLKNEVKGRAVCSIQNVGNFIVGGDLERNLFVLSENTVQNSLEGLLELTSVKLNDICYQIRRVERRPNISFSSFSEYQVCVIIGNLLMFCMEVLFVVASLL